MENGQPVTYTGVDGTKRTALIIGLRTEPETHIGTNNEPLLSLGYFTPGPTFGSADAVILHDVPHVSVKDVVGVGRWEPYREPELAAAAAVELHPVEVHPEDWKRKA